MPAQIAKNFFGVIGRTAIGSKNILPVFFGGLGGMYFLTMKTLHATFVEPFQGKPNKWGWSERR